MHAARLGIDHLVLDPAPPGGLLRAAFLVENMPGFPGGATGEAIVELLVTHARLLGVRHLPLWVEFIAREPGGFAVRADGATVHARTCILATGTRPTLQGLAWVDRALQIGLLHTDSRTLPARLDGMQVAVSGGGDIAFDSALMAVSRGACVTILMRGERPRAHSALRARVADSGIRIRTGLGIEEAAVEGGRIAVRGASADGEVPAMRFDHLVVCHGRHPDISLWRSAAGRETPPPDSVESGIEGLFCAGDMLHQGCRYVAVACGDGILACQRVLAVLDAAPTVSSGVTHAQ